MLTGNGSRKAALSCMCGLSWAPSHGDKHGCRSSGQQPNRALGVLVTSKDQPQQTPRTRRRAAIKRLRGESCWPFPQSRVLENLKIERFSKIVFGLRLEQRDVPDRDVRHRASTWIRVCAIATPTLSIRQGTAGDFCVSNLSMKNNCPGHCGRKDAGKRKKHTSASVHLITWSYDDLNINRPGERRREHKNIGLKNVA